MGVQLQAREKNLLSVLLIVLLGLGIWHLALASLWSRYFAATEAVQELTEKITQARRGVANADGVQHDQEVLRNVLARVMVPEEGDPGVLAVRRLNAAVRGLDLKLVEIKPATARKNNLFMQVPLTVRGEGDYLALITFLERIYRELPSYEVTRVQISGSQRTDKVTVTLAITARHFAAEGSR